MEALILILILSVSFVSFVGVTLQALKVSSRTRDLTEGLTKYESLVFELENGLRPDLASYGGRGEFSSPENSRPKSRPEAGYRYEIRNEEETESYALLKNRLLWKKGNDSLDFDLFASKGALQ